MSTYTEAANWYRPGPGDSRYAVVLPLGWEVGCKGSGIWVTAPEGFTFDVSVPRALRWLVNRNDPRFFKAACLHDYLLERGWDRVTSAAAFNAGLQAENVGATRALLMTLAVTAWRWKKSRREIAVYMTGGPT